MALIKSVRGFTPKIGKDTFLADNATIIGDVEIGEGCSIWFGTVLRGDVNSIRIGNGVNVQDGSVLHTLYEKSTIEIGDDVSIGHNDPRGEDLQWRLDRNGLRGIGSRRSRRGSDHRRRFRSIKQDDRRAGQHLRRSSR